MNLHPARLITELLTFTQANDWSLRDLAHELALDETALLRFRSGERLPSKAVLVKIIERFGEHRFVRDLVWYHLSTECRNDAASRDPFDGASLPPRTVATLRAYVERFAEESTREGRGLYIVGGEPAVLTESLRVLRLAFEHARVRMCAWRGDAKPNARVVRDALAAPVVLIERIDFASEGVREVVRRRADLMRPTVATSLQAPTTLADPYVRRIALSTMKLLAIDGTPEAARLTPTALHDAA